MKFRFCGGLDAPDWILGEVSTMSKFSSVRMKLLCRQIMEQLIGNSVNQEKVKALTTSKRIEWKAGDVKALIAALNFILTNSGKFDVEPEVLPQELEQLGLPGDICRAIGKVYAQNKEKLQAHLSATSLSLTHLQDTEWKVDYVLGSSVTEQTNFPSIQMNLALSKPFDTSSKDSVAFEISLDKFRVFFNEMRNAKEVMDRLE